MPTVTTSDGTQIFRKDRGQGRPVVLSHGWPLTADVCGMVRLLKIDPGAPRGLTGPHEQEFNHDLLAFLTS